jgi:hypothetical protein
MKRSIAIVAIAALALVTMSQTKKKTPKKEEPKMQGIKLSPASSGLQKDSAGNTLLPIPPNTIAFVMTPEQVQLLEYVIQESQAGFKSTTQCIQILTNQRYVNVPPKDTTAVKK